MAHKLRYSLSSFAPVIVQYMRWVGRENREFLAPARLDKIRTRYARHYLSSK
jgi:hypothetical protein